MQKSYLIFGVSKGLGKAITQSIPTREDFLVFREVNQHI